MPRLTTTVNQGVLPYYLASVVLLALATLLNHKAFTAITLAHSPGSEMPQTTKLAESEDGYPSVLIPPSRHPRNAALVIEDSVRYSPNSTLEWASLIPSGSGGIVRLGADNRLFAVSMFHQLQCLGELQNAVAGIPHGDSESARQHVHHCLNYIRQTLLCAASVRLEPVKTTEGGKEADGLWLEHRCRDWSLLRQEVEHNYEQWRRENGSDVEVS